MRRLAIATFALVIASACSDQALLARPAPPNSAKDAGTQNNFSDAGIPPQRSTVLREDFETRQMIESIEDAIVDVNAGVATLPAETFPTVSADNVTTISTAQSLNGKLEARSIVVLDVGELNASDSIEIRAKETLRVSGRISAGPGGIDLYAGTGLYIDGLVDTDGPIRLRVGDEDGTLEIAGQVTTHNSESQKSGDITISTRGSLRVTGSITTGTANYGDSGDITITTYGRVSIEGVGALIRSGNSDRGQAGTVTISTESEIFVLSNALVAGGSNVAAERILSLNAGDVSMRGAEIRIADGGAVEGGSSQAGVGGTVDLIAARVLSFGPLGRALGGFGRIGGEARLEATTATIGSGAVINAGAGGQQAGRVLIATAGDLTFLDRAQVIGGEGTCFETSSADGGDVDLLAAGRLAIAGADVRLRGGRGALGAGPDCFEPRRGGHVQILAQDTSGNLDTFVAGGDGTPPGTVSVMLDPLYISEPPNIRVRTRGFVKSRAIDRGPYYSTTYPRLLSMRADTPRGSGVTLELGGADDTVSEPAAWYPVVADAPELLEGLQRFRFLKYRLHLFGRALDAPNVDYFEIDLTPVR